MTYSFIRKIFFFSLVVAAAALLDPELAYAQSQTVSSLGDQTKRLANEVIYIPQGVAMLAYALGVASTVRGLLALRKYVENSEENPIGRPIGFLLVGAMLIALPWAIRVVSNTIGADTNAASKVKSSSGSFCDEGFGQGSGSC